MGLGERACSGGRGVNSTKKRLRNQDDEQEELRNDKKPEATLIVLSCDTQPLLWRHHETEPTSIKLK